MDGLIIATHGNQSLNYEVFIAFAFDYNTPLIYILGKKSAKKSNLSQHSQLIL